MWHVWKLLGSLGFFVYKGVISPNCWPCWWPVARVSYLDGSDSQLLPVGNAWVYARCFNGKVVRS